MVPMTIICSFIWSVFQPSRPLSLGLLPEQNYNPLLILLQRLSYAGGRPKQKATATLAPQQQSREETTPKRCPYHAPPGTPVTHELPTNRAENKEVLH